MPEVTIVTTELESHGVLSDPTDEIVSLNVSNIDRDTDTTGYTGGQKNGPNKGIYKRKDSKTK